MPQAHVIEIAGQTVGIASADRHGVRFHAAVTRLAAIDGQFFHGLREAEKAARALARRRFAHSHQGDRP